ncbi:GNAT family N-acetyltransferase [Nitratireductor thuwali]|uniref:BioF2-like acetyltransferase domain-containing protein n=1 Tax=Nitratireductor thuwali TaxID=2267699 RepID=A0ABY5MNH5_9HYPH|nr:hypothetical protein NTH_02807 [Nitratireductor thuwali]
MFIDTIRTTEELHALRGDWDRIYASDPDAQFFLSWNFMHRYLRRFNGAWFILAARPGRRESGYVALLPLRLSTKMNGKTGLACNEINMGGNFAADYTGILTMPEHAGSAVPAFAAHLKELHWAKLHLENFRGSERKWRTFVSKLSDAKLAIQPMQRINSDNIDNCICPAASLPESWDLFLERNLSSNTRQKLRRFLRKVENSDAFGITHADASTVERDIEILLEFWRIKWSARKGKLLPGLIRSNRSIFRNAFQTGNLFLPVLWHGERPLGALAIFLDPVKKALLFYMAGRDEQANDIPAGLILHGHSIRYGIENGFRTYDFLRGNEPYKYSFGVTDTSIRCAVVRTTTGRNLGDKLDSRSLHGIFKHATEFHKEGRLPAAQVAYTQILQTQPSHRQALYQLGQLLTEKGAHRQAAEMFGELSKLLPASLKVWLRLGFALKAAERFAEAIGAFEKAMQLSPGLTIARYAIGQCLLRQGRVGEATDVFRSIVQQPAGGEKDRALRKRAWLLLHGLTREDPHSLHKQDRLDQVVAHLKNSASTMPFSPDALVGAK